MDIKHSKEGEIAIITINGRLDADTAPVADKTIKKILEGNCSFARRIRKENGFLGYSVYRDSEKENIWGKTKSREEEGVKWHA
jgi:DNA invertase Pin-like site-specific DNA recombinase